MRLAVLGRHGAGNGQLHRHARDIRTIADADSVARTVDGSAHVMASVSGHVRIQGTVTGLRRVFSARLRHCTVAGDRPDVLAHLANADIDDEALACHLLAPPMPSLVMSRSLWRGVRGLPTRDCLLLDTNGRAETRRWWRPPPPELPLSQGAAPFGEALSRAVGVRAAAARNVSSDLGGFDSTTLCCLAARHGPVVACTGGADDPAADDLPWARRTAATVPGITHLVLPLDQLPDAYAGALDSDEPPDAPCPTHVDRARFAAIWQAVAREHEPGVHFTGCGGDEIAGGTENHVYDMLRAPRSSWRTLRGFKAEARWSLRSMLAMRRDRRPYGRWLAEELGCGLHRPGTPDALPQPWGYPVRMPPWVTPDAFGYVRTALSRLAEEDDPWSPYRGQHCDLDMMFATAQEVRHHMRIAARLGFALAAPYYDDRVVEAGLAVRAEERVTLWTYKPLLPAAVKGLVPDSVFARTTKAEGSHAQYTGWLAHRERLLALCEDSRLAARGLIDARRLREALGRPLSAFADSHIFESTIACETWLRTIPGTTEPRP
ncbi:asparagine synthase-related protein [Streptomyces sp. NPDC001407]|uniref:asparagine synthase-related protein n=1 Tax=Streptomyces sp. NPDC001407 TaxID=3364573 RepID=UPI0036C11638